MNRLLFVAAATCALSACDNAEWPNPKAAFDPADRCAGRAMPISSIQGHGSISPQLGNSVVIDAVVVGDYLTSLGGIFVQDQQADRDGSLSTSEGMFIALEGPRPRLAVGDVVRAEGLVAELGPTGATLTSLTALTSFRVCGKAEELPLPAIIEQALLGSDMWETFEGMRLSVEAPLTVIDQQDLYRRGQLTLSLSGRQWQPTEIELPGEAARLQQSVNDAARIVIDDGQLAERPETLPFLKAWPRPERPLRIGSRIGPLQGVLDQREGQFRLYPEHALDVQQAPRPTRPPDVDGRVRAAAFNLLNYFNGDGNGEGFPTGRGASSEQDLERQRGKLIATLLALNADVFALTELENDGFDERSAVHELARELDRKSGRKRDYVALSMERERLGDDVITVGLIYDQKVLEAVGAAAVLEQGNFAQGRPVLLQGFRERASEAEFSVAVVHFKSKGGCQEAGELDRDRGDGQGCHNTTRTKMARELADWLDSEPSGSQDADVLILGDFNAHSMEDPIRLLAERGYVRIGRERDTSEYSYNYRGQSGSLDHALASASLLPQIGGAAPWHSNADELVEADYRQDGRSREARRMYRDDPYRASDHDPLLVGLDLGGVRE